MPSPTTHGPIDFVKCPHCGHGNDFRELHSQQLLDTGNTASCDRCLRIMTVVGFAMVQVVRVRQSTAREKARAQLAASNTPPPRRATTLSPAQTRKLLKGR